VKLASLLAASAVFGASVLTITAQQPAAPPQPPNGATPAPAPAVIDPPDKPTWAYAVAPGAQIAGAPRGARAGGANGQPGATA